MVTKWIGDFQAANRDPEEEVVFDVLCGDLNFDNCSPGVLSVCASGHFDRTGFMKTYNSHKCIFCVCLFR